MTEKRTKIIKLRVSESEYEDLKTRCDRAELAPWMREVCLNQHVLKRSKVPDVDPKLLRQLAGIGNNLNQIARVVNSQRHDVVNLVKVLAHLADLERQLDQIYQNEVNHDR
jgi:hypothetical protein